MKRERNDKINAVEFISSWEKKWKELTKLDFFIYRTINNLIKELIDYFQWYDEEDKEDLRILGFLIGDHLEAFLTSECFGECPLKCPVQLQEVAKLSDIPSNIPLFKKKSRQMSFLEDRNKKEILHKHILNFVVKDTLIDFVRFDENQMIFKPHSVFRAFINKATDIIIRFIDSKEGQHLLLDKSSLAGNNFEAVLKQEDAEHFAYLDFENSEFIDLIIDDVYSEKFDEDEKEDWQTPLLNLTPYVEDLLLDKQFWGLIYNNDRLVKERDNLEIFNDFLSDFSDVSEMNDIDSSLLREFFSFYLPYYFSFEEYQRIREVSNSLRSLFSWMERNGIKLRKNLIVILDKVDLHYKRFMRLQKLMQPDANNLKIFENLDQIVSYTGFYQVIRRMEDALILKVANLSFSFKLQIPPGTGRYFRKNDILDLTVVKNTDNHFQLWQLNHLYTGFARMLLLGEIDGDSEF